jgi:DNA-binding NarL/FixJ family response regulator
MSVFRILLIEDSVPWLEFLRALISRESSLEIIGLATDGQDGIAKAEALSPDLILLDIDLPKLNGITVARTVRTLVPKAHFLFVSQNADPAVVREALSVGSAGYVLKTDGREILAAIEGVRKGARFVSPGLRKSLLSEE